ncbi:2Fe-2S iron-sulfur cluster binding domain-containing protein [Nocardia sp. NPDC019395]|uniref:2Fe-2S iron-sulfur cluster-binding protein n=1 Tax=Nocardia sp. NPDC019395 TaxID=3154686 RepID=UPI0033C2E80F
MRGKRNRRRPEPAKVLIVELRRSGIELVVPPALTVLEALERRGIGVPSMCRAGLCGACEHRPLAVERAPGGRDHRPDQVPTPIRLCVTTVGSVTRLVLDL